MIYTKNSQRKITKEYLRLLKDSGDRYKKTEGDREDNINKLNKEGQSPLTVDTKQRVEWRFERLGLNYLADQVKGDDKLRADKDSIKESLRYQDTYKRLMLERIIGDNDMMPYSFIAEGFFTGKAVGRVNIQYGPGNVVGYGTGHMITPRLMMTNNHVLENEDVAEHSIIEFNYEQGIDGALKQPLNFALEPDVFFFTDPYLDFTIVAVSEVGSMGEPLSDQGYIKLEKKLGKVLVGERVNVIQHPHGEPKQVAIRQNRITNLIPDFIHYEADTLRGSSGSPVFSDQWESVAIHHMSVPAVDKDGNILKKDGKVFDENNDSPSEINFIANEGARISSVVDKLEKLDNLSLKAEKLRDEVISIPPASNFMETANGANTHSEVTQHVHQPIIQSAPYSTGNAINIPLQLSINLSLKGSGENTVAIAGTTHDTIEAPLVKTQKDPIEEDVEVALEEYRNSYRRPYYDKAKDEEYIKDFYSEVEGPRALPKTFNELHRLLKSKHRNRLSYKPSRRLYPWVDLQPDMTLQSIYTEEKYDTERFIREAVLTEQKEEAAQLQITRLKTERSNNSESDFTAELELLERQLIYNCEHVVPQSWFRKKNPMRGDLHHLFTCEAKCNSFRGNLHYFDFPDYGPDSEDGYVFEGIREDCGKSEGRKFEPYRGKGIAARAVFYFLVRYPGEIDNHSSEMKSYVIETLKEWHNQFPVTEYERHRNMAIYEMQGNRNPFIDYPDEVASFNFIEGLG